MECILAGHFKLIIFSPAIADKTRGIFPLLFWGLKSYFDSNAFPRLITAEYFGFCVCHIIAQRHGSGDPTPCGGYPATACSAFW